MAAASMNEHKIYIQGAHITKSPCRDCTRESDLPGCSNNCQTISQVRALSAGTIWCSKQQSEYEEYSLSREISRVISTVRLLEFFR